MTETKRRSRLFAACGSDQSLSLASEAMALMVDGEFVSEVAVRDGKMKTINGTSTGEAALAQRWGDEQEPRELQELARLYLKSRPVSLAVSGRILNANELRKELTQSGVAFSGLSDSELLLRLMARSPQRTIVNCLVDALWKVRGPLSVIMLTENLVVGVRGAEGLGAMVYGTVAGAVVLTTDSYVIPSLGGEITRELRPGEMLIVDDGATQSISPLKRAAPSQCLQELLGLQPTSAVVFEHSVAMTQQLIGARLGKTANNVGVVVATDSSYRFAMAFSEVNGAPLRGFITSNNAFAVCPTDVKGHDVVLLVRQIGSVPELERAVFTLRGMQARSVHLAIALPQNTGCPYGVALESAEADVAPDALQRLARHLGVASILQGDLSWVKEFPGNWCTRCLGGVAPIQIEESDDQLRLI